MAATSPPSSLLPLWEKVASRSEVGGGGLQLGAGVTQFGSGVLDPLREFAHHLQRKLRHVAEQLVESVLRNLERGDRRRGYHRSIALAVAKHRHLADEGILLRLRDGERMALGGRHLHLGLAVEQDVGGVARLALAADRAADRQLEAFGREGENDPPEDGSR